MKQTILRLLILFALISNSFKVNGQLAVSNTLTPQQLAQLISGPGVKILNPVINCGANGYGKYNAASSNLNITEGLLLTTGTIYNAVGPNNVGNKTTYFGNQSTPNTYTLLNGYTGKTTWEYCEFEFDIIPQGDTIKFDFVFASEEYEEWVGSQYNDVFGFFISGPGITGDPGAGNYHNIALLPSSTVAVTINNVNQNINTAYYQNNNNGTSVQYDGFTRGLKAISKVTPCDTFHLKLVVADVSDKLWDSGVFIEKISSNNIVLMSQTAGGIPNMVEGCNNGQIIFTRPNITSSPLTVTYWLGGTATNGTDYPLVGSSPSPLNPKNITIPAGQASATLNINPIADGINEGYEYMTVYLGNPYCSNQIMDSLRFYIQDSLYTTVTPVIDSICVGQSVSLNTTGGGSAFSWSPIAGLNNPNIKNPVATPASTTIYTLTTTASTCVMKRYSKINVSNAVLSFTPTNVTCNGANNGSVQLGVSNGFAPYTYTWTGPASYASNNQNISGLAPGTYSVIVKGLKGCTTSGTVSITQPSVMTATLSSSTYNGGYNISCFNANNGSAFSSVTGGVSPYTYTWSSAPTQTTANASNLTAGTYTLQIKDNNNCVLSKTITLTQPALLSSSLSGQVNVLCYGNTTGAATVAPSGGTAPFSYTWTTSPVQSNSIATNLSANIYTVYIKDANNCTTSQTVTITQPATALTASISSQTNVACFGNSTGSASISASGGTGPYTYTWNTTPAQNSDNAVNLPAGSYVVTVKDANNCSITVPVTITQPATNVSAMINSQTNVSCFGGNNGSASVIASGGVPGYTYLWNSVPSQSTATASNLTAGTYTVIVKDANNCSVSLQANITQPLAALSATISSQTNVLCYGNNSGSATTSASGGTPAYTYSWSTTPAQTSATAVNLIAGIYSVTVKDANNCTVTKTVSITQPTSAVTATITSHNNVLCYGASSATAAVSASGGVGGYTYSWNTIPLQTAATATGLAAANYTVTVKDANNCLTLASVNISQPSSALSATITNVLNVKCKTNATGAATVVASGGSGSYSYLWNSVPSQTTATASGLVAGNYSVNVYDNNGCTVPITKTITITEPAAVLSASSTSPLFNGNNISCFNGTNGSINLTPTGGTPSYTFAWSGPSGYSSNAEDINSLSAGNYSVLITDANGCTHNYTTTLTQPTVLNLTATITPATCPAFNDGAIGLIVSGGTAAYTYTWTGPGAFTSNLANISGLIAGGYSITITDANGCQKSNVYTVTQPGAIVITNTVSSYPGGNNVSCFGGNNGNIGSVTVTGGTPVYTYLWSGPSSFTANTANISSLYAGTYQLVVTDNNGCIQSKQVTLTQPAAITSTLSPSVYAGNVNITCFGAATGSINTSPTGGTPGYTYNWNGPSSYTSTSQNISGLIAGSYTLTITDINSCTGLNYITLKEPTVLSSSVSSPTVAGGYNITCNGASNGAVNLLANGGTTSYTYLWNGPASYTSTSQNPSGLIAGTYSVLVTDANNCTTTNTITLTQPNALIASATSPTLAGGYNISCYGNNNGSINLNMTGGTPSFIYSWTGTGAYTSNQQNPNGLVTGSYTVVVTDANNCSTSTNITLTQPALLTSNINSSTFSGGYNISCNGLSNGTVTLTINGGTSAYSYAWNGPASFTSTLQNPVNLQAGLYNVTTTDANGCITTASIILTQPNALLGSITSPTYAGGYNITCNGNNNGAIYLNTTGGTPVYNYNWSGPASYTSTAQNPSGLIAGTYSLTITDANLCSYTSTIGLTQPNSLTGSISSPTVNGGYNITCNGLSNGVVTQTLSGGTLPYSINWSNGSSSQNLNNVPAGTYTVIINDANNCTITQTITLTQPNNLFASASSPSFNGGYNINCFGNTTGTINLGAIGGTTPYNYNWSGPSSFTSTAQNLVNIGAGTYTAITTDANNCTYTSTITLTQPNILVTALSSYTFAGGYNISCNGSSNGSILSNITGGTQAYTFNWSGPSSFTASTANLSNISAGTYTLICSDANGCSNTTTINLTQPPTLTATATSTVYTGGYNISCNGYNNGNVNLNVTGGTSVYTYSWTGPATYTANTQNISNLVAGTYSVLITDANSCVFSLSQTLTEPLGMKDTLIPSVYIGGNNVSCFSSNNGTLQVTTTGGTGPYTQIWNGPAAFTSTATSVNGLIAGTYSISITDANGCVKNDTISLHQPAAVTQTLSTFVYIGGYNIKCKGDSSGIIFNTINGGIPGYTFNWNGPAGFTANTQNINNIAAGTYTVAAADTNGCVSTATLNITEPPVALSGTLTVTDVACYKDQTGSITLNVTGSIPGYTFWWRGPKLFTSSSQNISSLYAGHYDVVIADTNGCQISIDTVVHEPAAVVLTYTTTNPVCKGVSNGSITTNATGGTSPYTYNWSNGASTPNATNLSAGTYSLIIVDVKGCVDTAYISITEPKQVLVIDKLVNEIKCYGDTVSSINVAVTGGISPYTYNWSTGATGTSINNLGVGMYIVTVTDSIGCVRKDTTTLTQPDSLYLTIYSPLQFDNHNITYANGNDGLIDLTVHGGTNPFSYLWSNNAVTEDLFNLTAGVYNVTVVDTNGCRAIATITLTEPYVLQMPEGFSPNLDGKNDVFVIHGLEAYPNNELTIYNRWGNIVYSKNGYLNDWNGTSNNGQVLPDGTYFAILEINKGEIVLKGYVELRR